MAHVETRPRPGAHQVAEGNLHYERLILFTDAVFAIAITLTILPLIEEVVVIGSKYTLLEKATELIPRLLAFIFGFAVVAVYWASHHRIFQMLETYDAALLRVNLLFAMLVSFVPVSTYAWSQSISPDRVVLFAVSLALVGFCMLWLWIRADRSNHVNRESLRHVPVYYVIRFSLIPTLFTCTVLFVLDLNLGLWAAVFLLLAVLAFVVWTSRSGLNRPWRPVTLGILGVAAVMYLALVWPGPPAQKFGVLAGLALLLLALNWAGVTSRLLEHNLPAVLVFVALLFPFIELSGLDRLLAAYVFLVFVWFANSVLDEVVSLVTDRIECSHDGSSTKATLSWNAKLGGRFQDAEARWSAGNGELLSWTPLTSAAQDPGASQVPTAELPLVADGQAREYTVRLEVRRPSAGGGATMLLERERRFRLASAPAEAPPAAPAPPPEPSPDTPIPAQS